MPPATLAALRSGERRALARAISTVENGAPGATELAQAIAPHLGHAHVIGITGAPGAGKSTLIHAVLGELLARGARIAVVAVDPSSPVSGGAVLGDRVRMGEHGAHERVFIRSVSSRGHLGGVSRTTERIVDLFDAAGYDVVLVETVGAGQSEVEITALADTRIVVCPPGLGDEVQALKAGILEIADAFVVSKGDLPAAESTVRDLRDMLRLRARGAPAVPVLRTVAPRGEGIRELVDFAFEHARHAGLGRRLARVRAPSVDEIAAVDRALASPMGTMRFADTAVARAAVEAVLSAAGHAPADHAWSVRVLVEPSLALPAPVVLLCVARDPDVRPTLACGMWVQRIATAARARGLDAMLVPLDAEEPGWWRAHKVAGHEHPALAIGLGHPEPGGAVAARAPHAAQVLS